MDGRADRYALGCAAFELLAGVPPFRREEAVAVLFAHVSEPPPLLTSWRPDLPPAADQVLARACARSGSQGPPQAAGTTVPGESQTRERDYPQTEEYSSDSG